MSMFPSMLASAAEARLAAERIRDFLLTPDLEPVPGSPRSSAGDHTRCSLAVI